MDYLGKGEMLTNTDLDSFVNNIWGNRPFVYIEKVLDLWVQLMKNGTKTKVLHLYVCSVYIAFLLKSIFKKECIHN